MLYNEYMKFIMIVFNENTLKEVVAKQPLFVRQAVAPVSVYPRLFCVLGTAVTMQKP